MLYLWSSLLLITSLGCVLSCVSITSSFSIISSFSSSSKFSLFSLSCVEGELGCCICCQLLKVMKDFTSLKLGGIYLLLTISSKFCEFNVD